MTNEERSSDMPDTEKDYAAWMAALGMPQVETPEDYPALAHELEKGESVRREDALRAALLRQDKRVYDKNAENWREALLRRRGGRL